VSGGGPGPCGITVRADALVDGFRDLTYAYRFGPRTYDLVTAELVDPAGRVLAGPGTCPVDRRGTWIPTSDFRPRSNRPMGECGSYASPPAGSPSTSRWTCRGSRRTTPGSTSPRGVTDGSAPTGAGFRTRRRAEGRVRAFNADAQATVSP